MYYPWPALKHDHFTSSTTGNVHIQWLKTNIFEANWNKGVVFWCSQVKPWRHEKQTLTFPHNAISTWEQTATSSKCPSASIKNSETDKLTRISQLEYCRGTSETLSSEREFPQPCRDFDRLHLNMTICVVCRCVGHLSAWK